MSAPVHQWFQGCSSSVERLPQLCQMFPDPILLYNQNQHPQNFQYQLYEQQHPKVRTHQHQQTNNPQYIYSYMSCPQILNESNKTPLIPIHLYPTSTDCAYSSSVVTATIPTNTALDNALIYGPPSLLPKIEEYHSSVSWETKQQTMTCKTSFTRSQTPIPETISDSTNSTSYLYDPCLFDSDKCILANDNNIVATTTFPEHVISPSQAHQQYDINRSRQYRAVDQLSENFLHLAHLYYPVSLSSASPPSLSISPCSSTTSLSINPASSPALSLPYSYKSPYKSSEITSHYRVDDLDQHSMLTTAEPQINPKNLQSLSGSIDPLSSPNMSHHHLQVALTEKRDIPSLMAPHSPVMNYRRSQTLFAQKALSTKNPKKFNLSSSITKSECLPFVRLATIKNIENERSLVTAVPPSPLNSSRLTFASPFSTAPSSSRRLSPYSTLICQICKKEYANNSTLRRHLKIHAYANTSTTTRKICSPFPRSTSSSPSGTSISLDSSGIISPALEISSTENNETIPEPNLATANNNLLSSLWTYHDPTTAISIIPTKSIIDGLNTTQIHSQTLNAQTTGVTELEGMIPLGYNPGMDPTIKKPECVGCNKPFARRDTVILHIKNQKRKWDLLCTMLPALSTANSASATLSDCTVDDDENDENDGNEGCTPGYSRGVTLEKLTDNKQMMTATYTRSVRQRKTHPFRVAEKLWHSTLQSKKIHFGPYKKPISSFSSLVPAMKPLAKNDSDSRLSESESARNCQTDVGIANTIPQIDQTSDEWPSQEVLDGMDNQTKVRWMIKMAVVPPCWSERKVRLFGAYGMVEEAVLQ